MRTSPAAGPHASRRRDDGGASAVEFALISTLLFLLLFGTLQYGWYFYQRQGASNAVREAARASSVGRYACGTLATQLTGVVAKNLSRNTAGLTVRRTYARSGSAVTTPAVGDELQVSVAFRPLDMGLLPLPDQDPATSGPQIVQAAYTTVEATTTSSTSC